MAKVGKQPKLKPGEWVTRSGTVVTTEVEERWSHDCQEDLEMPSRTLPNWTRVRVGDPLAGGERVSRLISVRVSPDLFDAAQAKAENKRRSIANLARAALTSYVDP